MSNEAATGGTGPGLPGPHKIYEFLKDESSSPAAQAYRLLILADTAAAAAKAMQQSEPEAARQMSAFVKTCTEKLSKLAL